jgi:hypothetical protein
LAKRAEKLMSFGEEPKLWYALLKPVLEHFVKSFEDPDTRRRRTPGRKLRMRMGGFRGDVFENRRLFRFFFFFFFFSRGD